MIIDDKLKSDRHGKSVMFMIVGAALNDMLGVAAGSATSSAPWP